MTRVHAYRCHRPLLFIDPTTDKVSNVRATSVLFQRARRKRYLLTDRAVMPTSVKLLGDAGAVPIILGCCKSKHTIGSDKDCYRKLPTFADVSARSSHRLLRWPP
jgi:hypothetical protein